MLFLGDIRLKAAVELGLEDISKNPWLLNDVLGDTVSNPYLRERYGSQIESCKQWLANNRINVYLSERDDKMDFPSVVIKVETSNELPEMKTMADLSVDTIKLIPNVINKPIPYVVKPLLGSYDLISGSFSFGSSVDLNAVSPKMILVNPATSTGYIIQSVTVANQVNLLTGLSIQSGTYGIVPEYHYYEARIGQTWMREPYKITCNANDQQTLLWLHSIATYSLLRYRQVLLEADGYAESMISSSPIYPNPDYSDAGQVIWSRDINITGIVPARWISQPHRIIENIAIGNGNGYEGGIKILSNITDNFEDLSTVSWSTLADIANQDE